MSQLGHSLVAKTQRGVLGSVMHGLQEGGSLRLLPIRLFCNSTLHLDDQMNSWRA